MKKKTLRANDPGDLLAMVPRFLGFHPEDSVVLVLLGKGSMPYVRVDLPVEPADCAVVLHDLMLVVRRHRPEHLAVVVYSEDALMTELVVEPLTRELSGLGVGLPVVVRADGERWFCLGDGDGLCEKGCPPEGTPYDVSTHPLTLEAVVDGQVILDSRQALRDSLLPGDPDEVEAVTHAMDVAADRLLAATRLPLGEPDPAGHRAHLVREGRWLQHCVRRFLADGHRLDAHDIGRMLVAMVSVEVRDVAWAEMTRRNADAHVDLWRDVVRRSPLDSLAAPAALLAFASWLAGNGALAWCAVERSQEADPGYRMAGLVTQALAGAVPPSSWKPLAPEALTLFAS